MQKKDNYNFGHNRDEIDIQHLSVISEESMINENTFFKSRLSQKLNPISSKLADSIYSDSVFGTSQKDPSYRLITEFNQKKYDFTDKKHEKPLDIPEYEFSSPFERNNLSL